jgi:hypothetical protein
MPEPLDPLSDRARRVSHVHGTGIERGGALREGACLRAAVREVTRYAGRLENGHPDWHPAFDSFRGLLPRFIHRGITSDDHRPLERIGTGRVFGLDHDLDESTPSRT